MGKYNTTEIVICPHCNGEGELREDVRDNLYESHIKNTTLSIMQW